MTATASIFDPVALSELQERVRIVENGGAFRLVAIAGLFDGATASKRTVCIFEDNAGQAKTVLSATPVQNPVFVGNFVESDGSYTEVYVGRG
jgi:hypothetical protein